MRAGLDPTRVLDVISKGAAQSWQMENRGKTMIADKFDFGFAVDWMRKDLAICLAEARAQRRRAAGHRARRPVLRAGAGARRRPLGHVEPDPPAAATRNERARMRASLRGVRVRARRAAARRGDRRPRSRSRRRGCGRPRRGMADAQAYVDIVSDADARSRRRVDAGRDAGRARRTSTIERRPDRSEGRRRRCRSRPARPRASPIAADHLRLVGITQGPRQRRPRCR